MGNMIIIGTVTAWSQYVLGQAAGNPPAVNDALKVHSIWDFVVKGGWTMIPIGLVSLIALTVVIERLLVLRRRSVNPPGFLPGVSALLSGERGDRRRALEYCKANGSPIANVVAAAIKHLDEAANTTEKQVEEAGQRELVRFRRHVRLLSALPQVSTMLGLVGTIFGMIKTFQAVAVSSQALGKTELLARGIYEAWTTTASGLIVAIPVLIAYHVVLGRIDARVAEIDQVTLEWLEQHSLGAAPQRNLVEQRPAHVALMPPPIPALAPVAAS